MRPHPIDRALLASYFLLGPICLLWATLGGEPSAGCGAPTWRALLVYGAAAPAVAVLVWRRHPRARFAVYVFLTMDILRSLRGGHLAALAIDVVILIYLQTPRMRRLYPRIDGGVVIARLKGRRRSGR